MKTKIISVFILGLAVCSSAQPKNALTGLTFLKLGVGARAIGMGEAYSALSTDASGIYYNAAGISFGDGNEVAITHKQWVFGTTTEFLGSTVHVNPFTFGIGFNSTNVADIEVRQQPGPAQGTFGLHDLAISATASWRIDTSLSVGATAKFLYEKIYLDESNGVALDFGARYQIDRNFAVALAFSNLGTMSRLVRDPIALPFGMRSGASYTDMMTDDFRFTLAGDVLKIFHDEGMRTHLGGEIVYRSFLALRSGYQLGYEARGFSAGFGILYGLVQFDYAFAPFLNQLGDTHTFALTFNL